MFWIEFNYGKFIWPQHRNGAIDVLSEGVVKTVDDIFGITFVQACDWK